MAATQKTQKTISFRALQLANEQRSSYGLRYNDFQRYRKHCANRTHRLRSTLKMTHGKGREFKKLPPITAETLTDGHLQLLLLEAERAWSYSQELISLSLQPANEEKAGTLRHSATGRFRRAVNWSTQLLSLCQSLFAASRLSAENLLQATVYTLILNGRFLSYRDEFEDALTQLSVARGVLDELAAKAPTSHEQALAVLFSDEIGPEIRYCAHEMGRSKAYDVDSIVKEFSAKHRNELVDGCDKILAQLTKEVEAGGKEGGRRTLASLTWEGQPVPVRNPELVDVFLRVQDAETRLDGSNSKEQGSQGKKGANTGSKKGVAAYDAILLALSDAEDVARKLVEAQQSSGTSSGTSASGTRDIHFVHAYIIYQLLARRIQRDLLLVSALLSSQVSSKTALKAPSAINNEQVDARLYPAVIKLLETVLQSLTQMRTLSVVDESSDLASAIEARLSYAKAQRCNYLARCYAPLRKYAESLTLLQHANIHLRETRSALSLSDSDPINSGSLAFYLLSPADVDTAEASLAKDAMTFKRDWFTHNGGSIDADGKSHKKPLFFNIALNYVELDMNRLQERAGKAVVSATAPDATQGAPKAESQLEKMLAPKVMAEEERSPTPEPKAPGRSGLSSLLGGWWGKN